MSSKAAILLCSSFRRKVAWSGPDLDKDAALQECLNSIYSMRTEEERADLYAALVEAGFTGTAGMLSRKLIATTQINSWNLRRVYGKIKKAEPVKQEFTL